MLESRFVRTILILVGIGCIVSLFVLPISRPATTVASLATAPPRDTPAPPPPPLPTRPPGGDNGGPVRRADDGKDRREEQAAIYGQVTDLSTGRPGQGLEVEINGSIVRTDASGQYSLTGLGAGSYTAVLRLPAGAVAAQSTAVVNLAEKQVVTLDLSYYSQTPPSPPPTDASELGPTSEPAPASPDAEDDAEDKDEDEDEDKDDDEDEDKDDDDESAAPQDASAAFSPLTPVSGGDPAVWINPGHINNEEGVTGSIALDVANVSDLGAFQATLNFDPKVIEVDDVVLGNFLDSTGRQTNPLVTDIDNTAGEISFVAYTSGDEAGPNGGGTLAVINFISKQAGVSDLDLEDVLLVARLGRTINAQVGDGLVSVTTCFGDLNGDDAIDVSDVQAAAGRVGQSLGDPNFVLEFDLDNDNAITENDVILVTARLYEVCP